VYKGLQAAVRESPELPGGFILLAVKAHHPHADEFSRINPEPALEYPSSNLSFFNILGSVRALFYFASYVARSALRKLGSFCKKTFLKLLLIPSHAP